MTFRRVTDQLGPFSVEEARLRAELTPLVTEVAVDDPLRVRRDEIDRKLRELHEESRLLVEGY